MNGKGSKPRNNFSRRFGKNYDQINWKRGNKPTEKKENLYKKITKIAKKWKKKFLKTLVRIVYE